MPKKNRSGTLEWFFEIIAKKIEEHSRHSSDYMPHEDLSNALLQDPDAAPFLEQFSREDPEQKSTLWWAGNRIAWFSQQWTVANGGFPYDGPLERQRVGKDYEYKKSSG